mmetsp:Transcript_3925/g.5287  ORF Transcript_3925/g.5287 Transcript_3925/m.5287 type:complete len:112 (+) Transcript_3925:340-675(+)
MGVSNILQSATCGDRNGYFLISGKKVRISSLIPHSFDLLSSHSSLLQPALMIELDAPLNISWKHIFLYSTISKTFQHFLFIIGQNANTFLQLFTQEKHEQISKHGEQKWSV